MNSTSERALSHACGVIVLPALEVSTRPPDGLTAVVGPRGTLSGVEYRFPCHGLGDLFFSDEPSDKHQAKRVCAGCEHRAACLVYAVEWREQHGIWGGVDFSDRAERHCVAYDLCRETGGTGQRS